MSENSIPRVFLIGGPPGAGKTTLGTALANRLGIRTLSVDDLVFAVQTVTTPKTFPGLHLMWKTSHLDYFTNSSVDKLKEDAIRQHEVAWPFIKRVIRKHAQVGPTIVIDGWHLWPSKVSQLQLENIWAGWIVVSPSVLEERERKNADWFQKSNNPKQMLENFLSRSLWFNTFFEGQATELEMNVLPQQGEASVNQLCDMVLENING